MTGRPVRGRRSLQRRRPELLAILGIALSLGMTGAVANARAASEDLLAFIRAVEAPGGYDDYERRIPVAPPRKLTRMTVSEVLEWQQVIRRKGATSSAAGAYQIIHATLADLVATHGISRHALFDAEMQDRLARLLLARCGARPKPNETARHPRYANCLARIWAGLPLVYGPERGRSAYHRVAGNRALVLPEAVLALLASHSPTSWRAVIVEARSRSAARPVAFRVVPDSVRKDMNVRVWTVDPYASQ